jgi:hypothetical protein
LQRNGTLAGKSVPSMAPGNQNQKKSAFALIEVKRCKMLPTATV